MRCEFYALVVFGCLVMPCVYGQQDAHLEELYEGGFSTVLSREVSSEEHFKEDNPQISQVKNSTKKKEKLLRDRAASVVKSLYRAGIGSASVWLLLKMIECTVYDLSTSSVERLADLCSEEEKKHPFYEGMLHKAEQEDSIEKPLKIGMQVGFCGIIVYAHKRMNIFQNAYADMKEAFS